MSSETDKLKQTIRMADIHIERAREAFDLEQRERVDKEIGLADYAIRGSLRAFHQSLEALEQAHEALVEAERDNEVDLTEAYVHMTAAETALAQKEYGMVVEEAGLAMGKCLAAPELGRDLVLTTALTREGDGIVHFDVKVGSNLEGRVINELHLYLLRDTLPHYLVVLGEEDVVLEKVEPEGIKTHRYRMEVKEELTDENETLLGRDLGFVHLITKREGGLIAEVEITNYSNRTLTDIKVKPFLPEGYLAEPSSQTIDLLPEREVSGTLQFRLYRPGEEEMQTFLRKKELEERRARTEIPLTDDSGLSGGGSLLEDDESLGVMMASDLGGDVLVRAPEDESGVDDSGVDDLEVDDSGVDDPGVDHEDVVQIPDSSDDQQSLDSQLDPLADDDDDGDILNMPNVDSSVLEQSKSEFADTKYDSELEEIEQLKPSWKGKIPLDGKDEDEDSDWQFPWGENGSNGSGKKDKDNADKDDSGKDNADKDDSGRDNTDKDKPGATGQDKDKKKARKKTRTSK